MSQELLAPRPRPASRLAGSLLSWGQGCWAQLCTHLLPSWELSTPVRSGNTSAVTGINEVRRGPRPRSGTLAMASVLKLQESGGERCIGRAWSHLAPGRETRVGFYHVKSYLLPFEALLSRSLELALLAGTEGPLVRPLNNENNGFFQSPCQEQGPQSFHMRKPSP